MEFQNADGKSILLNMVQVIQDNKAYLGEVDGLIGDGDHGMNMNKGFTIFRERIAEKDICFSEGLSELGLILLNEIGGSMGPIYGTIFTEMANVAEGKEDISLPVFSAMLDAGLTGLAEIIDAKPGDKTIIDTLSPACESLRLAVETGLDFSDAMTDLIHAAETGRDSTIALVAKYGRASRLGERSKGVLDAGATSCCIILCAMAEAIRALTPK
jgi:dihydroxyacetone kinase-like protein